MKIAVCFYGKFSGKNSRGEEQNFKQTFKYFKRNILVSDPDIYFHGWDDNEKSSQKIVETLKPKKFLLEKQINFDHPYKHYNFVPEGPWNTKNYINNNYSRFYSLKKSVELLEFNYDFVMISRFDSVFYKPFPFEILHKSNFYASNWHLNKEGWGFNDAWFISGSNIIKDFSLIFDRLNDYFDIKHSGYVNHLVRHGLGLDSLPSGHAISRYRCIELGLENNLHSIGLEYKTWGLVRRIKKRRDPWGGFKNRNVMIPEKI
jgi:hypothetical protein